MWGIALEIFFCTIIFLLSLVYGTKNISKFDIYCLVAAIATLVIYFLTENALLAVSLVATIDLVGFLPTFRKGWEEPDTETVSTFVLSAFGKVLSIAALENYSLITTLYVVSLLFTNTAFSVMIWLRRNVYDKQK